MPTYVYACDTCGTQFEQFQSFKDEPLRTCPSCEGAVRRVFQPVGIVFKGSGWYITDSRKSSSVTVGADDAGGKSDSGEKAGTSDKGNKSDKSDASPATAAPAKSETTGDTKSSSASAPASS
jgi:putative FmdB family regulatory protein